MSAAQPCFRCKGENNSEYNEATESGKCISCSGLGVVVAGPVGKGDEALIRRYVYAQWWVRLREMKKLGMRRGKKKDRDKRIKKQARGLFADFQRMGHEEQLMNRTSMAGAIEEFKELPCAS